MQLFPGKRLIVFDIDGTLIYAHDIHVKIYQKSLREVANVVVPNHEHEEISKHFGKPEDGVFAGILETYGVKNPPQSLLRKLVQANIQNMKMADKLITPKNVLLGVKNLLELLQNQGYVIGVISGNPRPKGEALLRFTGLKKYVKVSAFFNDKKDAEVVRKRADILRLAVQKASRQLQQKILPSRVVVVGDTPSDIQAGKEIGAYTLGVATGNYTMHELEKYSPSRVVRTFMELPGVAPEFRTGSKRRTIGTRPRVHLIQKTSNTRLRHARPLKRR